MGFKNKSSRYAHLADVNTISGHDVSHMTNKQKSKISKLESKNIKEQFKAEVAKQHTRKRMMKKYGTDTTNLLEHDARSKIDTRDYGKRKMIDATAHVLKISPYVSTMNNAVNGIFDEDDN